MRYSFVDVETTGLDPEEASIVELAIVTTDDQGRVLDRYETLLNPLARMAATRIHGIRAALVASAPTFPLVAADVAERLDRSVLVAYNAKFDAAFVEPAMRQAGARLSAEWFCALTHARSTKPGLRRYRLVDVASSLGVSRDGTDHRALSDAELCARVFFALGPAAGALRPASARAESSRRVPPCPRASAASFGAPRRPGAATRSVHRSSVDVAPFAGELERAFRDDRITPAEVKDLTAEAEKSGLTTGDLVASFNLFLERELDKILSDGTVDADERQHLRVMSHHLGFPAPYIEDRLCGEPRPRLGGDLQPGLEVVFTNLDPDLEWHTAARCARRGIAVRHSVSRSVDLVVHAGAPTTTKAARAVELGIPLMPVAAFLADLDGPRARSAPSVPPVSPRAPAVTRPVSGSDAGAAVAPPPRRPGPKVKVPLGVRLRYFLRGG